GQGIQRGEKAVGGRKGHVGTKMRQRGRVELCRIGKKADAGIVMQDGKAVQHRVARHIRAADVQQPANAVGQC
ncbi:MAG: hypothetical protein RLZZ413_286, partial [Pseudomonadota bacterium]